MAQSDNRAVIFSFIAPNKENATSYSEKKQLLSQAFQSYKMFENGELLDSLERRALYPMVHCSTLNMDEVDEIMLLRRDEFAEAFTLQQGIYVESQYYQATRKKVQSEFREDIAYIFMGFKSLEPQYSAVLEKSWKDWSGARLVNACLKKEFYINRFSFYHRLSPEDTELFMYILVVECHNVKNSNITQLLDFVQKLRVERVFGYLTVYRRDSLASTAAVIKGLLSNQDEYASKIDI